MKNEMELSFVANIQNEAFARTCVSAFIASLNPTIDEIIEIKTMISEGVSNAIIHGYDNDGVHKVVLKASYDNQKVMTFIVQDYGKGIENIEEARQPMFTSKKEIEHAGMGLTIIETLCDSLDIESSKHMGTKLIIKKRLKTTSEK